MSSFSAKSVVALGFAVALAGCKIVHDGDKAAIDPSDPNNFNAQAYVAKLWDSKAIPFFHDKAHPVADVLAALAKDKDEAGKQFGHQANPGGSPWTFAVNGSGKIKSMSSGTRHGEMVVEIGPADHPNEATLQVGPVVYGTAIRDALPFVAFGDFVNQIQYAEVSRAMNDRAVAILTKSLNPAPQTGQTVTFSGAMVDPSQTGGVTITPVELHIGDAKP